MTEVTLALAMLPVGWNGGECWPLVPFFIGKDGETEASIPCPLVHSTNAHNRQGWATANPGARSSSLTPSPVARAQAPKPSTAASEGVLWQGAGSEQSPDLA